MSKKNKIDVKKLKKYLNKKNKIDRAIIELVDKGVLNIEVVGLEGPICQKR